MSETRLAAFIAQVMGEQHIPGVAAGVWQAGETRVVASGVTNVDCPLPVTEETLFQVGSITKTFTALLMMQLVEEGRLDLGATVQSYLPDFRVADETVSRQATIRHLLTHTAGWVGDLFEDTGEGDDASARYVALMADLPQLAPLGMTYSYNNASFYLAGAILEAVTGRFYADLLQERALDPLGMTHSYLKPTDVMTYCYAVGHDVQGEGEVAALRPWALPRAVYPVGGLITTVPDLLRYGRFQMGDGVTESGERLLTADSMQQMHTPQAAIWGETEAVGLSWFIKDVAGTRILAHGGGTKGQVSYLFVVPERDFAAAIVTNSERGGQLTQAVYRWLLHEYLDIDDPEPQPVEAEEAVLAEFVGRYERPFSDIELVLEDGRLLAQLTIKQGFPDKNDPPPPSPPPMPLALCGPDRLVVTDDPMKNALADVIRGEDGRIGWLRVGRLHRKVG